MEEDYKEYLGGIPVHPVASLFPMADDDVLQGLAEDIKQNGLREPIVTVHNGGRADNVIVVDGRNRFRACELAGVEPVFTKMRALDNASLDSGAENITDESLSKWIISHNLHRRHLTASQRAMIAEGYQEQFRAAAELRMKAGKKHNPTETFPQGSVADQAGELFGVSGRSVRDASYVKRNAPERVEDIRAGRMSVSAAAKEARGRVKSTNTGESRPYDNVDMEEVEARARKLSSYIPTEEELDSLKWRGSPLDIETSYMVKCRHSTRSLAALAKFAEDHPESIRLETLDGLQDQLNQIRRIAETGTREVPVGGNIVPFRNMGGVEVIDAV